MEMFNKEEVNSIKKSFLKKQVKMGQLEGSK